ncbi:uncharacterized protein zgc:165409 isoform X2 [Myxocyprinus asiaticus]|uniref:uncharacterized protein zgc:165409 isoform X2 n=1 Tax=Myxocyprinus asiaticus TaxID=70543 RepID=UPI00222172FE|nr:uncharacterized protein zgc:165409 isoform X2 [Myxocyprinus asiaticus]
MLNGGKDFGDTGIMAQIGRLDEYKPENECWSAYIERVELYIIANDVDDTKQVATLLSAMGASTYGLLRNLVYPEKPKDKTFEEIVDILKSHFETQPLVVAERFLFQSCAQKPHETVSQYVAELKQCASKCEFGGNLDEALRDRFVSGIQSKSCQRRLLSEHRLTFSRALEIALSMETADQDTKQREVDCSAATMQKIHVTICKDGSSPGPISLGENEYKCPFCHKVGGYPSLVAHVQTHEKCVVKFKGYKIYKCHLGCAGCGHYHCSFCFRIIIRKNLFSNHLQKCATVHLSTEAPNVCSGLSALKPASCPSAHNSSPVSAKCDPIPLTSSTNYPKPLTTTGLPVAFTLSLAPSTSGSSSHSATCIRQIDHKASETQVSSRTPLLLNFFTAPKTAVLYPTVTIPSDTQNNASANPAESISTCNKKITKSMLKRTTCCFCNKIFNKKNMKIHIQRRHSLSNLDVN